MANKFQQSVLQRLEQEAKSKKAPVVPELEMSQAAATTVPAEKKKPAASKPKAKKTSTEKPTVTAAVETVPEETPAPVLHEKGEEVPPTPVTVTETVYQPDFLAGYLNMEPARQAKNKTFYLDVQVIDAVKAAARQANIADSKLVNDILRAVLKVK